MDLQFWWMLFKIILSLLFIVFLIYIFGKYGGKLKNLQGGRYINVLERTQISKENSLLVVKIGEKGYVISSSNGRVEIICPISEEELWEIERTKKVYEYKDLRDLYVKSGLQSLAGRVSRSISAKKLKVKKEDRDER